jgi:hypothetical protein
LTRAGLLRDARDVSSSNDDAGGPSRPAKRERATPDLAALDTAVRAAFKAGDGDALVALSREHKALEACAHESPWLHRIGDLDAARGSVRVLRCVACEGRLYLRRQRGRGAKVPGLSIDLTLDAQRAYVEGRIRGGP